MKTADSHPNGAARSERALRATVVVSLFGYAAQALSLVSIPLFLQTVGAEDYGLMVTVMAFMGYINFADGGLSWGSMILIGQANGRADREGIAHIVRHSAVLALGSGLIVALVLAVIEGAASAGWRLPMFVGHPESDRLLLIAGAQVWLNLQFGIVYNLFQGLQESYWTGFYQGCGRLAGLIGAMFASWLTHDVAVMLATQLGLVSLAGFAAAIHAWRRHPWAFRRGSWLDRAQLASQLRVGAKSLMLQIGRTLGGTAPTLAISAVLGPALVPFYTVPLTLLTLVLAPINSWNANLQSAYGEAWESGARDWVRAAFRTAVERALLMAAVGIALFFALADKFVGWWTHDRLSVSPAVMGAVAAIVLLGALLSAGQFLLTGLNRHRRAAVAEMVNGMLTVLLVTQALRWCGLWGVGPGVVLSALLTSGWVLRRELTAQLGAGFAPGAWFLGKVVGAAAAGGLVSALVLRAAEATGAVRVPPALVLAGMTGVAVFLGLAFRLNLIARAEAVAFGRQLWNRLLAASGRNGRRVIAP